MKKLNARQLMFVVCMLCSMCFFSDCSVPNRGLFTKRTPHELYENKISNAGLENTALGVAWMKSAEKALHQPIRIQLPFKGTDYFAAEEPGAAGYIFSVRRGQKLNINIMANDVTSFLLFADLWRYNNSSPILISAADTINHAIVYDVEKDDSCIIRIQPELLKSGSYTLTIMVSASLAFPVPSESNPKIGSFWGAARDNGARKHEGIDIFGKFRTPVVAAADGYITGVRVNELGGKVIFLQPGGKSFNLYYAHLDSQIVKEGQYVKTGDVIGLMGNTGNAKFTPTHLHFGIYTATGAIDPLPFVDKTIKQPKPITASIQMLNTYVRTNKSSDVLAMPNENKQVFGKVKLGTPLHVISATGSMFKVRLSDLNEGFINSNDINTTEIPVKTITTDNDIILLTSPNEAAKGKYLILKGTNLPVLGTYKNFYFVKYNSLKGWIQYD